MTELEIREYVALVAIIMITIAIVLQYIDFKKVVRKIIDEPLVLKDGRVLNPSELVEELDVMTAKVELLEDQKIASAGLLKSMVIMIDGLDKKIENLEEEYDALTESVKKLNTPEAI